MFDNLLESILIGHIVDTSILTIQSLENVESCHSTIGVTWEQGWK